MGRYFFYSLGQHAAFNFAALATHGRQDTVEGQAVDLGLQSLILSIFSELGAGCLHFGVVVAPATLLFRLLFFSFVPGEIGLFSTTLTPFFIVGATSAALLSGRDEIFGGGPIPLGRC